jgi:hypothetical protein
VRSRVKPLVAGAVAAAWGINDAGTVIVGSSNSVAVAWVEFDERASTVAIALEAAKSCKERNQHRLRWNPDFTTSGTIVGQACGVPVMEGQRGDVSIVKVVLPSTRSRPAVRRADQRSRLPPIACWQVNGAGAYWTNF